LPLGNYDNLKAVAEDVTVYGYEQTAYESSQSPDGKFTFKFVNTRREFTVTFDLGDGTVISQQTVAGGKVASKPEDPVRTGYKFVQWMNGQEPYDFSTPVTGDLTLTAQWKEAGEYFVAEGQDSIWQKEDSQLLLFHIRNTVNDEKTYGKFTYIEVDGQKVEADTREAQMGGIIIELKPGFLETLSLGRHILRVYFSDGAVDVIFHVVQTEAINETLPDTGDNSNLLYWIGRAFIGAVGIIVLLKRRKRNS
ncbi:MAG: InlB B-repeat-containing protein, partial [Clostridia bacterium]|nr:InlB B-repeat-containing protein [Clostridia bacterium]